MNIFSPNQKKTQLKKIVKPVLVWGLVLIQLGGQAIALSSAQRGIYQNGIYYFNDVVGSDTAACTAAPADADATPVDSGQNAQAAFQYFVGKGLTPIQSAGIVGNMVGESGVNPTRQQDNSTDPFPKDGVGFGLIQWTFTARQQPLVDLAKQEGKPVTDLGVQLDYVWQEMSGGYRQVLGQLRGATALTTSRSPAADTGAVVIVQGNALLGGPYPGYERPADESKSLPKRVAAAQDVLTKYGGTVASPTPAATTGTCGSACGANAASGTTVVLDPGHGPNFSKVDTATGLNMMESNNKPEIDEVWAVTQTIKTQLENDGYKVLLTKPTVAGDGISFRDRADVANNANAAIAVSIHDDHSQSYGSFKQIYPQEVGAYRGTDAEHNKTTFDNQAVAATSKKYSDIFSQERKAIEGGDPVVKLDTFAVRTAGFEPGNIPMVQLFSKVPWVYNEVGAAGNLSGAQEDQYAKGIINGIEKSVPLGAGAAAAGAGADCSGGGAVAGDAVQTAINYAWPDHHDPNYCQEKPTYVTAMKAAVAAGQYTGGTCTSGGVSWVGVDCGAFVTRVMIDSGADPGYNYDGKGGNTVTQQQYLDAHPDKYQKLGELSDTSKLQSGDIAINSEHTYLYVNKISGFNGNSASASFSSSNTSWRAPMASDAYFSNDVGSFTWYRLIKAG